MSENWGAFEIAIVVILVVGALNMFFGVPDKKTTNTQNQTSQNSKQPENSCDKIKITKPKSLEKISINNQGVSVEAVISSCTVIPVHPDNFLISIVDAMGGVISQPQNVLLEPINGGWGINHFSVFENKPKSGNGYIIFTRISNSGQQITDGGARLPIRFVNP